jgi:hypothetical protein
MTAIVKDPKKLEAFVVYLQSVVRRQFPHDEITLTLNDDRRIECDIETSESSNPMAIAQRMGEIAGFAHGLLTAPTLLSKADMQCAVYLAQPFQPAQKLPD